MNTTKYRKPIRLLIQAAAILLAVEIILHLIMGHPSPLSLINPNPRPHNPDKKLGWVLKEGTYTRTINDSCWTATHLEPWGRATKQVSAYNQYQSKPVIAVYGDSFTYGDGLNDSLTFSYLLQEQLIGYNVLNKGVGGYSLVQCYFSLGRDIANGVVPNVVVLNTASFINMRNVAHPIWVSYLFSEVCPQKVKQLSLPYIKPTADSFGFQFISGKEIVNGLILYRISSIYRIICDWIGGKQAPDPFTQAESSAFVIRQFYKLSKQHNFKLLVTSFTNDDTVNNIYRECHTLGVDTVDLAMPLTEDYITPNDGHPNFRANRIYAQKILSAFKRNGILTGIDFIF